MKVKQIEVRIWPIETEVYVIHQKEIVRGLVEKVEINGFEYANYGIRVPERKTLLWLMEDEVFTDFEEFVLMLRKKFEKTLRGMGSKHD